MNQDNEELIAPVDVVTVLSAVDEVALHSSSTTAKITVAKSADNVSPSNTTLQVILLPYRHFTYVKQKVISWEYLLSNNFARTAVKRKQNHF